MNAEEMELGMFFLLFFVLLVVMAWLYWTDVPRVRARLMRRPSRPISGLALGKRAVVEGEVVGHSRAQDFGDVCFCAVQMELFFRKSRNGSISEGWTPWPVQQFGSLIRLKDPSGEITVNLEEAYPCFEGSLTAVDWDAPSEDAAAFRENTPEADCRGAARRRERVVCVGDHIKVSGQVVSAGDGRVSIESASAKSPVVVRLL